MEKLIGYLILNIVITVFCVLVCGCDLNTKDKCAMIAGFSVFFGAIYVATYLITSGQ